MEIVSSSGRLVIIVSMIILYFLFPAIFAIKSVGYNFDNPSPNYLSPQWARAGETARQASVPIPIHITYDVPSRHHTRKKQPSSFLEFGPMLGGLLGQAGGLGGLKDSVMGLLGGLAGPGNGNIVGDDVQLRFREPEEVTQTILDSIDATQKNGKIDQETGKGNNRLLSLISYEGGTGLKGSSDGVD